jgi:hypothetical protein
LAKNVLFTQKVFITLSKLRVWEARSGIRKKPILDPEEKKLFRIRIHNTVSL